MLETNDLSQAEALRPYLAEDRLHALARGLPLPDRTSGAVLFADIVGFTSLTEALTQRLGSREGVETLTDQINAVYGDLTRVVARWRGSLIGFSGDAITCWFDDCDGDAPLRAAACGLELQAAITPFAALQLPGGGTTKLTLKVAVTAGPARRFVVGDPAIQRLDVLAGALLERVSAGEQLCRPGDLLLDAVTAAALGPDAGFGKLQVAADGTQFISLRALTALPRAIEWEPVAPPPACLQPWILPAIRARHEARLGEFLTELRRVVALFLCFSGIDFDDDEEAEQRLDLLIRRAQVMLAATGGSLLQLTVGDKGAFFYAAFGAPIAYEDDARRAARAALALHTLATELDLPPFQIGLSHGVARTGAYGGPARRTYGALGDHINVAARLMKTAAPGTTLVTSRVHNLAGDSLAWTPLPAFVLKGKALPIAVSRLEGLRPDAQTVQRAVIASSAMIGRRAELAHLESALEELTRGQTGRTIVIEGEAGIGKSQLALTLLAEARRRGLRALVGGGDAVEQTTPAFAWRAVYSQLFGLDEYLGDLATRQRQVLHQLRSAGEPEALAPLLNALLPLSFTETDQTAGFVGAVRAEQTIGLLLRLVRHAAGGAPLLILLEDIHWLDPTSWSLLHQLGRERAALLVLTTRPPQLHVSAEYEQLVAIPAVEWLSLPPLTAEELLPLLCGRLGADQISSDVAKLILERADGNPYFSVEL